MGACCAINEPSITRRQLEFESKMGQRQETGDRILQRPLKKKAIKVLAAARGLFPWPNLSKRGFVLRRSD